MFDANMVDLMPGLSFELSVPGDYFVICNWQCRSESFFLKVTWVGDQYSFGLLPFKFNIDEKKRAKCWFKNIVLPVFEHYWKALEEKNENN
jgi:hypothetical protein